MESPQPSMCIVDFWDRFDFSQAAAIFPTLTAVNLKVAIKSSDELGYGALFNCTARRYRFLCDFYVRLIGRRYPSNETIRLFINR